MKPADEVLTLLDRMGKGLTLEEWLDLLDEVSEGIGVRYDTAHEDMARQEQES